MQEMLGCYLQAKQEDEIDEFFKALYILYRDRFPLPREMMLGHDKKVDFAIALKAVDNLKRVSHIVTSQSQTNHKYSKSV